MVQPLPNDGYSSASSADVDSVFECESAYDTDATEDSVDAPHPLKVAGAAWLPPDNEHPPEFYLQQIEQFDSSEYTREDYRPGTTCLLDRSEKQWYK
jgi:hypothetical protein